MVSEGNDIEREYAGYPDEPHITDESEFNALNSLKIDWWSVRAKTTA